MPFGQPFARADAVNTHEAAEAGNVRSQNCRKPPFHAIVRQNGFPPPEDCWIGPTAYQPTSQQNSRDLLRP